MGIVVAIRKRQVDSNSEGTKGRSIRHAVHLRLTDKQYRDLRKYVIDKEDLTGRRITHQAVLATALVEFLGRNGQSGSAIS
jgi:hypothetical protein